MMDLKEIIKWFIPCFHILLAVLKDRRLTFVCLFLLFNMRVSCAAKLNVKSVVIGNGTKNVDSIINDMLKVNQSDVTSAVGRSIQVPGVLAANQKSFTSEGSVGRTFGRPFKKMVGALMPLIFQIGAASTWAVVAALVGIKTLAVTLVILKILLIAGAAKVGALFGSKVHHYPHHQGWEAPHPPQKEIHLHIHNGHHDTTHDEHVPAYGPWSREDATNVVDSKPTAIDPFSRVGPQTIRTPFGNYVKVESNDPLPHPAKRK